jgi:YHS domain-containing protein
MRIVIRLIFMALMVSGTCGCASSEDGSMSGAVSENRAECLVCRHNADLACVDIAVTGSTPRADYQDKTFFFCSESCKTEFEKNPSKFAAK